MLQTFTQFHIDITETEPWAGGDWLKIHIQILQFQVKNKDSQKYL